MFPLIVLHIAVINIYYMLHVDMFVYCFLFYFIFLCEAGDVILTIVIFCDIGIQLTKLLGKCVQCTLCTAKDIRLVMLLEKFRGQALFVRNVSLSFN